MDSYRIRCSLVHVPQDQSMDTVAAPRDLLPWCDPYIAALVATLDRRHRDLVQERIEQRASSRLTRSTLRSEAFPPLNAPDIDAARARIPRRYHWDGSHE